MKISSLFRVALLMLVATASVSAQSKKPSAPLLPQSFAGFTMTGAATNGTSPAAVDATQASILKEFGFTNSSQATYVNGDNHVTVKAARFQDATGAYGAFTLYRQPQMKTESIGTMAVSDNERVLFFQADVLVEAKFDKITAMTGAAARELANDLPAVQGTAATLPSLPGYVPHKDVIPNTARYIVGPSGYASSGLRIPQDVIDFNHGAEVLTVKTATGDADLVLVSYPTPQIAIAKLKAFTAANPKDQNVTYAVKRTGPIVAAVSGALSESNARAVLGDINYEAEVTWNENTGLGKRDNIGNIVIAGITLAALIFVISVGTGAIFGFGRVFLRKILPERYAPKEEQSDFISLELKD